MKTASEIEKLFNREVELVSIIESRRADLGKEQHDAGVAALDGAALDVSTAVRLTAEIAALDHAIAACRVRRADAVKTTFATEAENARGEAAQLQRELDQVQKRRTKAIEALAEAENVPASSLQVLCSGIGESETPFSAVLIAGANHFRLRSEVIRAAILEADGRANAVREIRPDGFVDLQDSKNVADLLAEIARSESQIPPVASILAWIEACESTARRERNAGFGENPRRFFLHWNAGKIDAERSYVFVPALAGDVAHRNTNAATFRARSSSRTSRSY